MRKIRERKSASDRRRLRLKTRGGRKSGTKRSRSSARRSEDNMRKPSASRDSKRSKSASLKRKRGRESRLRLREGTRNKGKRSTKRRLASGRNNPKLEELSSRDS